MTRQPENHFAIAQMQSVHTTATLVAQDVAPAVSVHPMVLYNNYFRLEVSYLMNKFKIQRIYVVKYYCKLTRFISRLRKEVVSKWKELWNTIQQPLLFPL